MLVIEVEVLVMLDVVVRPIRCTRGVVVVVVVEVVGANEITLSVVIIEAGCPTEGVCPERFLASAPCIVASFWKSLSNTSEKQQFDMARVFGA